MDSFSKHDAATQTIEYKTQSSSSSSSETLTATSTPTITEYASSSTASSFKTRVSKNKLKRYSLSHVEENQGMLLNLPENPDYKNYFPRKQISKENYVSSSSSSSINTFNNSAKKEVATSTEKLASASTTSTSSTMTGSMAYSWSTAETETPQNIAVKQETKPKSNFDGSLSSSTSTFKSFSETPIKEAEYEMSADQNKEKKTAAEISVKQDLELDKKQREENLEKDLIKKLESLEGSMSSNTSSLLKDFRFASHSSKAERRKRRTEEREATLRFAKVEPESRKESTNEESKEERKTPALLKFSKSQHVRRTSSSIDNSDSSDDSTNLRIGHVFVYMVIPPDGGYGWLITFISFLCQVVVDGIIFSIGIVLPHIAKDFNIPGSSVVLVASMQIGFYFLFGTVSSAFINKFGFRPVALTGCLLSITVLTIATFSVNLPMMLLFYSILGGPALSMIWVSSQLIIGYYFDKYRPIANGAACSGAGAGIMTFSFINSSLVPILGWRNLMRLHVGFLIVVLIMTLTFIEVAPTRIGRIKEVLADDSESESFDLITGLTEYTRYSLKVENEEYDLQEDFETALEKTEDDKNQKPSGSCNSCLPKCCPFIHRYLEDRREQKAQDEATKRYVIKQDLIEKQDLFYAGPKDHKKDQQKVEELLKSRSSYRPSIADKAGQWRTISLEEIASKQKRHTVITTLSTMHVVRDQQQQQKDRQTYKELEFGQKHPFLAYLSPKNLLHPKIQKAFNLLFDFRLLAIMEFRILLLSAFLFPMGFNIPFVYSTVRAQIDTSFARLISPTIGFSNFAFRIASGFVAFKFREYTTYICGGGMFFGGVAVFVSAFYGLDVVWFQLLYAMCYGIAPAFYSTLRAIIYVSSLGLDKLTNAFGLTALAMGMGVFIGTTAGGILNDLTGSYTASFAFAGICICSSGALKLILPYLIKLSKDKEGK